MIDQTKTDTFTEFVVNVESKLRHALTASFGVDHGREALAEAFAYAWEHWDHIQGMDNPVGYLYRVAHKTRQEGALETQRDIPRRTT